MKKNVQLSKAALVVLLLTFFAGKNLHATTFIVTVQNIVFTPSTINVSVGDTVRWNWINGSHTTTCDGSALTSRPAGAASWSFPINSGSIFFKYVVTVAGTYNYRCMPHGTSGMVGVINAAAPVISLNLTSIIEGFWNGTTMVSDTVKTFLRNSVSPFAKVDSAKVKLSTSGTGTFTFTNAAAGSYYIEVTHRNGLETWSGSPVALTSGSNSYDFTTAVNKAYGNNLVLKSGKYTIFSGDVNQDGSINLDDILTVYNDASAFVMGYKATDVNGDNITDLDDIIISSNNSNSFVSKKTPLGILR